jgi:uncharacterized protein YyaL (SSP411 family)
MRILAGGRYGVAGFLEDHAAVGLGFFETWQLTGDRDWLDRAVLMAERIRERFWDDALPGFFDVPDDHEALITRPRDLYDNATPSGSSLAVELFQQVGYVTGDTALHILAERALAPLAEPMGRHPHAFGHALGCADRVVNGETAVALVGNAESVGSLLGILGNVYLPSAIIGMSVDGEGDGLALFRDRDARGRGAAAYVCRGTTCDAPAIDTNELRERISAAFPLVNFPATS